MVDLFPWVLVGLCQEGLQLHGLVVLEVHGQVGLVGHVLGELGDRVLGEQGDRDQEGQEVPYSEVLVDRVLEEPVDHVLLVVLEVP